MIADAVPFYEGVHFYYGLVFATAICAAWVKYIWPWMKPKIRAWRDRRLLLHGRPAIDGVAPEVPSLARRLRRVDKRLDETTQKISDVVVVTERLDAGQAAMIGRMDDHEKKVNTIQGTVNNIQEQQGRALEMLSHLFENGKNSNNPGDLNARNAEANGVYLENPDVPTFDPNKDKREGH